MALGWFRRPERDLPHCLIDMLSELLEIVSEQANELQGSGVIFRAIGPGLPRIENLAVDARHADRNFETERSEEHTSELQSLLRISYAVFCLHKKKKQN